MNKNYLIKMHSTTTSAESAKVLNIMFKLKKKCLGWMNFSKPSENKNAF